MDWGRGCPSGGMMHRFDKVTHRCRCGRWQAGFAPKKELVRPRAECQICERKQALEANGMLGHHGYKRPGWGFIQGDCFGVGYFPYPATSALELYLTAVDGYLSRCRGSLASLPGVQELHYTYSNPAHRRDKSAPKSITVAVVRGAASRGLGIEAGFQTIPAFSDLEAWEQRRLESEIENGEHERQRIVKRIAAAGVSNGVS